MGSVLRGGLLLLKREDALNQTIAITQPRLKSESDGRARAGKAEFLLPAHQASKALRVPFVLLKEKVIAEPRLKRGKPCSAIRHLKCDN